MKNISELDFGYNDAANYLNSRKYSDFFTAVFVKDEKLDRLMRDDTYFLIGDKGTGKTAYAVFLENHEYQNTQSKVVNLSSTDYRIFLNLRKLNFLQLSDYARIWKIILFMIMAKQISREDIASFGPKRSAQFEALSSNIDQYYDHAFTPEISVSFKYIVDTAFSGETDISYASLGLQAGAKQSKLRHNINEQMVQKFQNNLLDLERSFCSAFSRLKIKKNKFLFIDSVDVKIDDLSDDEYKACLQGLANAIWEINTSVFRSMPQADGFLKVILSIRTDMFPQLALHNQANKVRDNGVLLDWRTTYENYRESPLFNLCNNLLSYNNEGLEHDAYWDYYFPWFTETTNQQKRSKDDSFINCLRLSLSRPRDFVSIMKAIQSRCKGSLQASTLANFESNETQNEISNYYIDEARDWCLHKFSAEGFSTVLFFFQFLNGKSRFSYDEYRVLYQAYFDQVSEKNMEVVEAILNPDDFLQLLFDLNLICYYDTSLDGHSFFHFCYREREVYHLEPRVKTNAKYGVHYALLKALNLGKNNLPYADD